jgi:hypothetical protein
MMSIGDLADALLKLSERLRSENAGNWRYDPKRDDCQTIARAGIYEVHFHGSGAYLAQKILPLLLDANRRGIFDSPRLMVLGSRITAAGGLESVVGFLEELDRIGPHAPKLLGKKRAGGILERMANAVRGLPGAEPGERRLQDSADQIMGEIEGSPGLNGAQIAREIKKSPAHTRRVIAYLMKQKKIIRKGHKQGYFLPKV